MLKDVKLRSGNYMVPAKMKTEKDKITFKFGYDKKLLAEVKAFDGARWNPDGKVWTITNSERNLFQLEYLLGKDPYEWYDQEVKAITTERPARAHQLAIIQHIITFHQVIIAAEMGTGKSLSAIVAAEIAMLEYMLKHPGGKPRFVWVAPKSALRSVELELEKWKAQVKFELYTYDGLKRLITNWKDGEEAPFFLVLDESSRVKNHTSQRSQAAYSLAKGVREDHGKDGYVILMSGTPSPKSPADWFWQCEIAQPGFIKEGNIHKFKARLGLTIQKESIQGGVYPHHVTWFDNEKKCKTCGKFESDPEHSPSASAAMGLDESHQFEPSTNEIAHLYKRMDGLVHVTFKKDCLDLPEKQYEIIRVKPSASILRSASIIAAKSSTVIGAMILLRELSDGFQYEDEEVGTTTCPSCQGRCTIEHPIGVAETQIAITEENLADYADAGLSIGNTYSVPVQDIPLTDDSGKPIELEYETITCPRCSGAGKVVATRKVAVQVPCPKEDAVKELLDRYDDVGRTVWFAGFSGSIDRVCAIALGMEWDYIRVDGRGWSCSIPGIKDAKEMLKLFQDPSDERTNRLAFIGQAGAAGMGLTLTASPMICYYSNDFNAESRIQSEDRIHRMGMDTNRGATIYDIIHLATDEKVLNNLQAKRDLQAMTLGDMRAAFQDNSFGNQRLI